MLDFYLISDSLAIPESPDESNYIGGISLEDFHYIRLVINYSRKLGIELSFFSDCRVDSKNTSLLLKWTEEHLKKNKLKKREEMAFQKIESIFKKAVENDVGIVGFCD